MVPEFRDPIEFPKLIDGLKIRYEENCAAYFYPQFHTIQPTLQSFFDRLISSKNQNPLASRWDTHYRSAFYTAVYLCIAQQIYKSSYSHENSSYGLNFLAQLKISLPKPLCDIVNQFGRIDTHIGRIKIKHFNSALRTCLIYAFSFK